MSDQDGKLSTRVNEGKDAMGRSLTFLEVDSSHAMAAWATLSPTRVQVRGWVRMPRPVDVPLDDAEKLGAWVGEQLALAGVPRKRVVVAASRGEVALKHLKFPLSVGSDTRELASMVRLAMARHLTMSLEGSVIDYAEQSPSAAPPGAATPEPGAGEHSCDVLAAAMPRERVEWWRRLASAGGMKIKRVALRSTGLAALVAPLSQRRTGPVLAIAPATGSVEFLVLADGRLLFARSADVAAPGPGEDESVYAERVAVEAKRTWASARGSGESPELERVVVLGESASATLLARACGEAMNTPGEAAKAPPTVECHSSMTGEDRQAALGLLGLMVEDALLSTPTLDFLHPRRLPDLSARRRQLVLASILGLILIGGFGGVLASQELSTLESRLGSLRKQERELRLQRDRMLLLEARIKHLEQWEGSGVDWLAHARFIHEQMPDPKLATVDDLSGSLQSEVVFVPKSRSSRYPDGAWQVERAARINLAGRARRRETTFALRDALMDERAYNVFSRGAETAGQFTLQIQTASPVPLRIKDEAAAGEDAGKGQAGQAEAGKAEAAKAEAAKAEPSKSRTKPDKSAGQAEKPAPKPEQTPKADKPPGREANAQAGSEVIRTASAPKASPVPPVDEEDLAAIAGSEAVQGEPLARSEEVDRPEGEADDLETSGDEAVTEESDENEGGGR
ncbi:MAG: hypothetical protein SFZ23_13110 [Planctomycetota bacterium]|nr:hypothetical protein [Planctomycetota bacterium]